MAQGESLRHRLRVEHLERELKEALDTLNSERERMKVSRSTAPLEQGQGRRNTVAFFSVCETSKAPHTQWCVCRCVSVCTMAVLWLSYGCTMAVLCSLRYLSPLSQVTAKTLDQHNELMKKTETMSVLMETNKLLREERDSMQQELEQNQAKVP